MWRACSPQATPHQGVSPTKEVEPLLVDVRPLDDILQCTCWSACGRAPQTRHRAARRLNGWSARPDRRFRTHVCAVVANAEEREERRAVSSVACVAELGQHGAVACPVLCHAARGREPDGAGSRHQLPLFSRRATSTLTPFRLAHCKAIGDACVWPKIEIGMAESCIEGGASLCSMAAAAASTSWAMLPTRLHTHPQPLVCGIVPTARLSCRCNILTAKILAGESNQTSKGRDLHPHNQRPEGCCSSYKANNSGLGHRPHVLRSEKSPSSVTHARPRSKAVSSTRAPRRTPQGAG